MAKKLNFAEAKSKFRTDDEAVNYFTLVELYEKHLTGKQKEDFLSADTIDGMLDVLDEKQLRHLRSLLGAVADNLMRHHYDEGGPEGQMFVNEAFSKWFRENVFENGQDIDFLEFPIRIYEKQKAKTNLKDLVANFNKRLKKFDGDLGEYCQWLILSSFDDGSIPSIDRVYDAKKLLKTLDLKRLEDLKKYIEKEKNKSIILTMQYLEPYFYWLAINDLRYDEQPAFNIIMNRAESGFIKKNKLIIDELFEESKKKLIDRIESEIKEKEELIENAIRILEPKKKPNFRFNRIPVGASKTFEDTINKVAGLVGGEDEEMRAKRAFASYSKAGGSGGSFNSFLRMYDFLKELLEGRHTSELLQAFAKRMARASEYFERHLADKEYTVYRGMRSDGLRALLDHSNPKIEYKKKGTRDIVIDDDLISEINRRKPVIFDEGMVSTSLNKGVSSVSFKGKCPGNIFLTIKIPPRSKALVLDYEEIQNAPLEEEMLLAPRTKLRFNSIKNVSGHFEIEAEVVS